MLDARDSVSATHATSSDQYQASAVMNTDTTSQSSTSSPASVKASLVDPVKRTSELVVPNTTTHVLTPATSVASSQDQQDVGGQAVERASAGEATFTPMASGKKRTANGQVKEREPILSEDVSDLTSRSGHVRTTSTLSQGSNASLSELSSQLRTKLAYAMIKVQNGWQKHSIDEVESLASQSPRSALSATTPRDRHTAFSPRTSLSANTRFNSQGSNTSNPSPEQPSLMTMSAPAIPPPGIANSPTRKSLAPPATILSGQRRRPTPNVSLQINSSLQSSPKPRRPTTTQRTPSHNAAMEADAVETLLFMSTSPNNSGHFPSHLSAYSPTSQVFSAQASPLKSQFSMAEQPLSARSPYYSPRISHRRKYEDKAALIDRLLNDLDDDESEELDRAVKIMDRHQATKLSA